jgi:hypothetical protein
MYSTHLKQLAFGFDEAKLQHAWESLRSAIANRFGKAQRPALDPIAFALEACPPGRHVLKLGDRFRNVADELKTKLCRVTEVNLALVAVPPLPENIRWFDEILLLGVLERLPAPQTFLQELRRRMAPRGSEVVITTPNAASLADRLMLALARICGERCVVRVTPDEGAFTLKTLRALLRQTGYEVAETRGLPVMIDSTACGRWTNALLKVNRLLLKISPHLFADQICVRARPTSAAPQPQVEVPGKRAAACPQIVGRVE